MGITASQDFGNEVGNYAEQGSSLEIGCLPKQAPTPSLLLRTPPALQGFLPLFLNRFRMGEFAGTTVAVGFYSALTGATLDLWVPIKLEHPRPDHY
jgi:hypothetical protein